MSSNNLIVLIPASGVGERYGLDIPKQYSTIKDKTVLEHTLQPFINSSKIKQILLVAKDTDTIIDGYQKLSPKIVIKKVGGATRAQSVTNGLNALNCKNNEWILVHDAARCCLTTELLEKLIAEVTQTQYVGGILACRATDTVKEVLIDKQIEIKRTVPRTEIYLAQTPQMFRYDTLKLALKKADLAQITDEASAVELLGHKVLIVESCPSNIKITQPIDRHLAEFFLNKSTV
jgi:2-C-methyl-D-erythritol 4-phosphate cytidylyltransferase